MIERMSGPGLSMIAYVSTSTSRFDALRIPDLLSRARETNADLDVTGLLLYEDGRFLQILEGAADKVEDLFDAIQNDPRHTDVVVLLREPIEERKFPDWSMGFRQEFPVPADQRDEMTTFFQERLAEGRTSSDRISRLLDAIRGIVDVP